MSSEHFAGSDDRAVSACPYEDRHANASGRHPQLVSWPGGLGPAGEGNEGKTFVGHRFIGRAFNIEIKYLPRKLIL